MPETPQSPLRADILATMRQTTPQGYESALYAHIDWQAARIAELEQMLRVSHVDNDYLVERILELVAAAERQKRESLERKVAVLEGRDA